MEIRSFGETYDVYPERCARDRVNCLQCIVEGKVQCTRRKKGRMGIGGRPRTEPKKRGRRRMGEWRSCVICGTRFYTKGQRIALGWGNTCSKRCGAIYGHRKGKT